MAAGAAAPGTERPAPASARLTGGLRALAVLAVAVWLALGAWASPDIRGTDQYWYAEDVRTIVAEGRASTNQSFPFSLAGTDAAERSGPNDPVHHFPVLYVWAAVHAAIDDVHVAIQLANTVFALGTAALVLATARRFTSRPRAVAWGLIALYLPVAFWTSTQDLSEPFAALAVAGALHLSLTRRGWAAGALAGALAALAALTRVWAAPVIALTVLAPLVLHDGSTGRRLRSAAFAALAGGLVLAAGMQAMPSYTPPFDPAALADNSEGRAMYDWYRTVPAASAPGSHVLVAAARKAFANVAGEVTLTPWLSAPINLLSAATRLPGVVLAAMTLLAAAIRPSGRTVRFVLCSGLAAYAVYLAAVAVVQSQARYIVPLLPVVLVGAAAAFETLAGAPRRPAGAPAAATRVLLGALVLCVTADTALAVHLRSDALAERAFRGQAAALIERSVPDGARVALDDWLQTACPFAYELYPRPVLRMETDRVFDAPTYREALARFDAQYVIASGRTRLHEVAVLDEVASGGGYTVWRILGAEEAP